ncbi:MAG TPA: hypothetical protein VGQ00_00100 [Candidatus Norongarragalinales archaeon]|jgi:hypothetical protein|nr:hypothetical protein [Candidatus Norongarragalinales archaeon]
MNVTTVKVMKRTKAALDEVRKQRESYDDVIFKLVSRVKHESLSAKLVEGYKRVGRDDLRILAEWENASREV